MSSLKEVKCAGCCMSLPCPESDFCGRTYNGICFSSQVPGRLIDLQKSPYENLIFEVKLPESHLPAAMGDRKLANQTAAMGDRKLANQMLTEGTTCFVPKR